MGTWDATAFGNDDAADWAGDLAKSGTSSALTELLRRVAQLDPREYLDSTDGAPALAAAEIVAAAAGNPPPRNPYNEHALDWVVQYPELGAAETRKLAKAAVERVRTAESELLELWEEVGSSEWAQEVDDLLSRL